VYQKKQISFYWSVFFCTLRSGLEPFFAEKQVRRSAALKRKREAFSFQASGEGEAAIRPGVTFYFAYI